MTGARSFLFLQGPPTRFFASLGDALALRGHGVRRVNFNAGDALFWPRPGSFDYTGRPADWPRLLDGLIVAHGVTDLVLFGDCRPLHAAAIPFAQIRGVTVWVFDEGYLEPGFITLEQDGANGNSAAPRDPDRLRRIAATLPPAPPETFHAGSLRRRVLDDLRYGWANLMGRTRFPHWRTDRPWSPFHDPASWAWRLAKRPAAGLASRLGRRRALRAPGPIFLFPLQRDGDAKIRFWSSFGSVADAAEAVIASFARAAPAEARLVVTTHPLDNGLRPWRRILGRSARGHGMAGRVHHLAEAAHAPPVAESHAVVTVNGTAGLRALREGKPVVALGTAIYDMPGLTWQGELDRFWTEATPPDMALVDALQRVLAAHCLIRGGFHDDDQIRVAIDGAVERMTLRSGVSIPSQLAQG